MRSLWLAACSLVLILLPATLSFGFEPPVLVRERAGEESVSPDPCYLAGSRNGTCANYKWYNVCSGYLWIYLDWRPGEAAGIQFGGPENPCVASGNRVKRAITYFRNAMPLYSCDTVSPAVEVRLDADYNGDGCPDQTLASGGCFSPWLRWNCVEFNAVIPPGVSYLIVRQIKRGSMHEPSFPTDGPYSQSCDPFGVPRSFYYGINGTACIPWVGPTGRRDNFLTWLIIDTGVTSTTATSWGTIKGLFQ